MSGISTWAFHNKETGNVWINIPGSDESEYIGAESSSMKAYDLLASVSGLVRTGNWIIAYGPVRKCEVTVPPGWEGSRYY